MVKEIIVPDKLRFRIAEAVKKQPLQIPVRTIEIEPAEAVGTVEGEQASVIKEPSVSLAPPPVVYHHIRDYAGSLRARYAPYLTSKEWQALGQKKRKELVSAAQAEEFVADEEEASLAAAAAHIIEYCTPRDSRMGQSKFTKDGCTVTRLTIDHDLTSVDGYAAAEEAVYSDPEALL